jgi:hypothetical protein
LQKSAQDADRNLGTVITRCVGYATGSATELTGCVIVDDEDDEISFIVLHP